MEKNIIPTIGLRAFVCPHCHVFAQQEWSTVFLQESKMTTAIEQFIPDLGKYMLFNGFFVSKCLVCRQPAIWHNKKIIYPECSSVPVAHELMPQDVIMIYEEAGAIYNKSYKAAAALLRLALQILLKSIGGKGKKIDDDIRDLFEKRIIGEFKLFLDHWTKYISDLKKTDKAYGKVYERLYKDVTTEAYDNYEEYAIATVLRNYVVHAYDSIDHIHVDGENNKAHVLRDNLLRIHISASAKSIIQKQPEMIDLVNIAEKSLEALEKVQEKLIGYQFTGDTVDAAITLLSAKKRIDEAGIKSNFWMLVEVQKPTQVLDYKNGIIMQRVKDLQGDPVQDEKRILPLIRHGVDIGYKNLNWDGYLATACYVKSLWEKGYWKELQKKYS
jgi:uncharacterized protein YutE (UPF0331/DUF86 family)